MSNTVITMAFIQPYQADNMATIDKVCYGDDNCLSYDKWKLVLANPNILTAIMLIEDQVVAETVIQCKKNANKILRLGVHPNWRRKKIGSVVIKMLKTHGLLTMDVKETNESGLKFAKAVGFVATGIDKGKDCDWIKMQIPE